MGVCLDISTISDSNAGVLIEHPRLIWNIIFPQHTNILRTRNDHPVTALIPLTEPFADGKFEPEAHVLKTTLGEYWHGIHYLLCGEVWSGELPNAFLIDGGEFVGDIDVGYGPARVFTAEETQEITSSILQKTRRDLTRHYDSCQMQDYDIYPQIWDQESALPNCLDHFESLQEFLQNARKHQLGMVVYLTRYD